MKTARWITRAIVAFALIVILTSVANEASQPHTTKNQSKPTAITWTIEDSLEDQYYKIIMLLHVADFNLENSFTFELRYDCKGEPFYICVPDVKLDPLIDKLVDTYNADPSTTDHVEVSFIRDCMTEDIAALSYPVDWDSPFVHFLQWCHKSADLVYIDNGRKANTGGSITNYNFTCSPMDYANQEYRWQHTPDSAPQSKDS